MMDCGGKETEIQAHIHICAFKYYEQTGGESVPGETRPFMHPTGAREGEAPCPH